MTDKLDIRSLSLPDLETLFAEWGEARFRAKQVYEWLWVRGAKDWESMTNLSKVLRAKLAEEFTFVTLFEDKTSTAPMVPSNRAGSPTMVTASKAC